MRLGRNVAAFLSCAAVSPVASHLWADSPPPLTSSELDGDDLDLEGDGVDATLKRRDELLELRRRLFPAETRKWRKEAIQWLEEREVSLTLSYDTLWQGALGGGESLSAASGEVALVGSWILFGDKRQAPFSLNWFVRDRHKFGNRAAAELGDDMGAVLGTTDAFSNAGFQIPSFYLRQVIESWNLDLRYGQINIEDQIDEHSLRSVKRSFINRVFSTNPAVFYPRFGAGASAVWEHPGGFDLVAAVTQVQASKAGDQVDFDLDSSQLFYALQGGYDFRAWGGDPARLQALLWYAESNDEVPAGRGVSLIYEQHLKEDRLRTFGRVAYTPDEAAAVSTLFAAGLARDMFEADLLGVGIGVGESSSNHNWQAVLEVFYRWQGGAGFQVTPDLQIMVGEGFVGGGSVRLVPGIRGRFVF